ncbi:aconitase domain-containing protein [Haematococcus lacustris]|uniref:Aconitase domain-containing protein n=1 Tax=Haematococcus lacustris TaxID=44745 RepID=A0A699ZYG2_HAELA|nr:aconitase domain-containing protein [Haematococcus lacustris]
MADKAKAAAKVEQERQHWVQAMREDEATKAARRAELARQKREDAELVQAGLAATVKREEEAAEQRRAALEKFEARANKASLQAVGDTQARLEREAALTALYAAQSEEKFQAATAAAAAKKAAARREQMRVNAAQLEEHAAQAAAAKAAVAAERVASERGTVHRGVGMSDAERQLNARILEEATRIVKRLMTLTEKILAKRSDNTSVRPGDNIWTKVDKLMTHDVCGPGTFGIFQKEFGPNAKVWDNERVVIIPDHYIFTADSRANRNVDILRDMATKYNIKYFYDITDRSNFKANPDYKGVCHIALAQEGHCKPGEVLFGTDSHTCNAGAFGQFATGVGNTDAGFILGTGKLLIKVPPTMRFVMDGQMPEWLQAKDLILQIIGEISVSGATYKAMEFAGSAIEAMTMEDRMTICNMVVEAGGKNGVVAPDKITFDYVRARTSEEFEPVYSDGGADYVQEFRSVSHPLAVKE